MEVAGARSLDASHAGFSDGTVTTDSDGVGAPAIRNDEIAAYSRFSRSFARRVRFACEGVLERFGSFVPGTTDTTFGQCSGRCGSSDASCDADFGRSCGHVAFVDDVVSEEPIAVFHAHIFVYATDTIRSDFSVLFHAEVPEIADLELIASRVLAAAFVRATPGRKGRHGVSVEPALRDQIVVNGHLFAKVQSTTVAHATGWLDTQVASVFVARVDHPAVVPLLVGLVFAVVVHARVVHARRESLIIDHALPANRFHIVRTSQFDAYVVRRQATFRYQLSVSALVPKRALVHPFAFPVSAWTSVVAGER